MLWDPCPLVDLQDVFLPRLASRNGPGFTASKYTPSMSRIESGIGLGDMDNSESTYNSARKSYAAAQPNALSPDLSAVVLQTKPWLCTLHTWVASCQ